MHPPLGLTHSIIEHYYLDVKIVRTDRPTTSILPDPKPTKFPPSPHLQPKAYKCIHHHSTIPSSYTPSLHPYPSPNINPFPNPTNSELLNTHYTQHPPPRAPISPLSHLPRLCNNSGPKGEGWIYHSKASDVQCSAYLEEVG